MVVVLGVITMISLPNNAKNIANEQATKVVKLGEKGEHWARMTEVKF